MLSNKIKATVILGGFFGVLTLGAILGWAPYAEAAFQPQVGNGKTMATSEHLVIRDYNGMRIYAVSSNPQTTEERVIYVAWLEAQVQDLSSQLASINVPKCESEEVVRASGISEKIAAISARIAAFVAR